MTSISQETVNTRTNTRSFQLSDLIPKRWYAHLSLTIACLILGIPLYYSIIVATQSNSDVFSYQFTFGDSLQENWDIAINQRQLHIYIRNSIIISVAITIGKTILSLLAGLAFVYFRFPGKWLVFGFVLITLMMPTEVLIIALFRFVNSLGWTQGVSNYAALIVPFLASATGTFLFRQHFANLPAELSEAAQLDGATPLQFLFRVLIPMSWNTIGALAVVQFVYAWNMYLWPNLIITDQSYDVVQVGISTLRAGDSALQYGPLMLGSVLASLPPLIIFLLLQKPFMSGFQLNTEK